MPEIVEKREDAEQLDFYLSNRYLNSISLINQQFSHKCIGIEELNNNLPLKIIWVRSRAKKLFFLLQNNKKEKYFMFITYSMTGGMTNTKNTHCHIKFEFSESWIGYNQLYYHDVRKFGSFLASNEESIYKTEVTTMGKPFVFNYSTEKDKYVKDFSSITLEEFTTNMKKIKGKKSLITALMDQRSLGSGIGAWLMSEILYEARLNPNIKCVQLTDKQIPLLFEAIEKIIKEGYKNGGVSMKDYVHVDGTEGDHQNHLKIYGKENQLLEGKTIKKTKAPNGRSIYYIDY